MLIRPWVVGVGCGLWAGWIMECVEGPEGLDINWISLERIISVIDEPR